MRFDVALPLDVRPTVRLELMASIYDPTQEFGVRTSNDPGEKGRAEDGQRPSASRRVELRFCRAFGQQAQPGQSR